MNRGRNDAKNTIDSFVAYFNSRICCQLTPSEGVHPQGWHLRTAAQANQPRPETLQQLQLRRELQPIYR